MSASRDAATLAHPRVAFVRDLWALTKPGITAMVLCTTAGGLYLAPGPIARLRALVVLLTTAAVVSGANALNQYLERDLDGLMARTRNRPLPAHRLDQRVALWFGLALAALAVPILTWAGGAMTGLLAAIALGVYVLVYTPMKQVSSHALLVGAVPGAIPPLIGWTAAMGRPTLPGMALFGVLFLWQLPHFLAISLYRKEDYARAGLKVLPLVHGERATRLAIVAYTALLVALTLTLTPLGLAGRAYFVLAALAGAAFVAMALRGLTKTAGRRWARSLFLLSILYLVVLFAALIVDH
ncbi:MAG TPA: heme o synthase [Polyangia bacterium]|nr:heme o synthase [Polyangia bacterium]